MMKALIALLLVSLLGTGPATASQIPPEWQAAAQAVIGELMLAAIASALAIYGRGFVIPDEMPRLKRPEPVIIAA